MPPGMAVGLQATFGSVLFNLSLRALCAGGSVSRELWRLALILNTSVLEAEIRERPGSKATKAKMPLGTDARQLCKTTGSKSMPDEACSSADLLPCRQQADNVQQKVTCNTSGVNVVVQAAQQKPELHS